MADVLQSRAIPFAVIGAAAMAVHGVSRSTRDLDLFSVAPECLEPAIWEAPNAGGMEASIRRGAADDPLLGVVRFLAPAERPLDLVVGRGGWQTGIPARAGQAWLEGVVVPVARPADLILLKLYAGGPQDAWDITQLLERPDRAAVVAEVERLLDALPADCRRLWARVRDTDTS